MSKIEPLGLLTTAEAARDFRRKPATIRWWVHKGWLTVHSTEWRGKRERNLYLDSDVIEADNIARGLSTVSVGPSCDGK